MYHKQRKFIRRVYFLSGCERIITMSQSGWDSIDTIGELVGKTSQEVLQMIASQYPVDLFERHGPDAPREIRNRLIQWGDGLLGEPINAVPDVRIAPRP